MEIGRFLKSFGVTPEQKATKYFDQYKLAMYFHMNWEQI